MSNAIAKDAIISLRRFVFKVNNHVSQTLDHLHGLVDADGNAQWCSLFGLSPSHLVSYDDLFVGRVLYEASIQDGTHALLHFTSADTPLCSLYAISPAADRLIKDTFLPLQLTTNRYQHYMML